MRLRNKKTGRVIEWEQPISYKVGKKYYSLAELTAEWEDPPEEPKEYWYIDCYGTAIRTLDNGNEWDERRKEIGNRFETEEEAEKAVEKLKARTRLKDKGLKITGYGEYAYCTKSTHHINIALDYVSDEDRKDLDLLFGGEE